MALALIPPDLTALDRAWGACHRAVAVPVGVGAVGRPVQGLAVQRARASVGMAGGIDGRWLPVMPARRAMPWPPAEWQQKAPRPDPAPPPLDGDVLRLKPRLISMAEARLGRVERGVRSDSTASRQVGAAAWGFGTVLRHDSTPSARAGTAGDAVDPSVLAGASGWPPSLTRLRGLAVAMPTALVA